MRDTPRTDAALVVEGSSAGKAFGFVNADFARELERELEDSNRLAASQTVKCCKYAARIEDLERELAAMRSALVEIRDECFNGAAHDIAERALNGANHEHPFDIPLQEGKP
jgi:hypothetical protein